MTLFRSAPVRRLGALAGTIASLTVLFAGPVRARTIEDSQLWLSTTALVDVSKDVFFLTQVQVRYLDDMSRNAQNIILPPILGYRITPDLSISAGYGYTDLPQVEGPNEHENRLFQEVGYRIGKAGPGVLDTYVRFEQRFRSDGRDTAYRIRSRLRYKLPLQRVRVADQPVTVVGSIEPMAYLNTTDWGPRRGFDQFRTYAGVEVPLSRRLRLDAAYTNMIFEGGANDQLNHIAAVGLVLRL